MSARAFSPHHGNFWLWFGAVWFAIGVLFLAVGGVVAWREVTLARALARDGIEAPGSVLAKSVRGGASREPVFTVHFRFSTKHGAIVSGRAEVDGDTWNALREGGPVRVTYVAQTPERHRIEGESRREAWFLATVFGGLGALLALLGGFILVRAARTRSFVQRVLREGLTADAEVTAVSQTNFAVNRVPQWVIRYRYRDHAGREHEGRSRPMSPEEARQWTAGRRGRVRIDRKRPHRSVWVGEG